MRPLFRVDIGRIPTTFLQYVSSYRSSLNWRISALDQPVHDRRTIHVQPSLDLSNRRLDRSLVDSTLFRHLVRDRFWDLSRNNSLRRHLPRGGGFDWFS